MGGGAGALAHVAVTVAVAVGVVTGIYQPVSWFATFVMIAGKRILGGHLSSSVLSRTSTFQGIIIPEIQGGLDSFNMWIQLMLPRQNTTWKAIYFLVVS